MRRLTALLTIILIAALGIVPAQAGTQRIELLASASTGASGNGGGIDVRNLKELLVFADCTASSGTGEVLDLWLQTSSDGGTTWYDMIYERQLQVDADGTETAGIANGRDIVNMAADEACEDGIAVYTVFGDYVRVKYIIAGTGPSYTFSVKAIGKS